MSGVTASELAAELGLSKGRISQMVTTTFKGCHSGEGRQRRFDLEKSKAAYLGRTDPAQMLGNGAKTVEKIGSNAGTGSAELEDLDALSPEADAVRIATQSKAISAREAARRDLRRSAEENGTYVLASSVTHEVARQVGRLAGEVETIVLRDGARRVADELGVPFGEVRQILRDVWRAHRRRAAAKAGSEADAAELTAEENVADI